jgi:hypothetical protein
MVCILATLAAAPQQEAVRGMVFLDLDADGVRDAEERGLAGVAVSDQAAVATTDAEGRFALPAAGGFGIVFVSVPRGLRLVNSFWRRADAGALDFGLQPADAGEAFAFLHASDPHIDEKSAARLRRVGDIAAARGVSFVLVSGDLVRDALRVTEAEARGYYDLYMREIAAFAMPVWSAPGNHEIFGVERHLSLVSPKHPLYGKGMFRHYLGPNYFSFNAGAIHFVALDTVDVEDLSYYGRVDPIQLAWLERDLALLPADTTVVTFNHIPFFSGAALADGLVLAQRASTIVEVAGKPLFRHVVSNAGDVLRALRTRRHTLALGGHFHLRERLRFEIDGVQTRFEQAAAVVGPRKGANEALDFRSGVTLYRVKGTEIDDGEFIPLDKN